MLASENGHRDVVSELLAHPKLYVNQSNVGGGTALIIAAEKGHTNVVVELMKHHDIEINKSNSLGGTAFILAAKNGHTDAIQELLKCEELQLNKPGMNILNQQIKFKFKQKKNIKKSIRTKT